MVDITTKNLKFGDILLLLVCFFLTFKQLNVLFPSIYTMIFLLVGCIVLLYYARNRFRGSSIMWLVLYTIVLALNYLSGDTYFDSVGDVVQEVAILFFTSTLTYYIFTKGHMWLAIVLVFITLAIILYYSISSYYIELEYPGVIRNTVYMTNVGDLHELRLLYLRGLSTYQFSHAVPILIPPLVVGIRKSSNNKRIRIFFIVVLIAIFVITFISYAATALFLSIIMLILTLIVSQGSTKNIIINLTIAGILFLPIIISPSFFLKPLYGLLSSAEDASYIDKLMDIQKLTDSGVSSGSVAARETKYVITINEVINHLLVGTNERTGEHSAILDRFACLGLVGWIPYLIFIYFQLKAPFRRINREFYSYYVLGVLAALFMLFTKNMSNWETWFLVFTILPLMTWLLSQKSKQ